MDDKTGRTLRIVVGPILLFTSLLVGDLCDHCVCHFSWLLDDSQGLTKVAVGGVVLFALGFVWSSLTIVFFQLVRILTCGCIDFELAISSSAIRHIETMLNYGDGSYAPNGRCRCHRYARNLSLVVMYQRLNMSNELPLWMARRWTAFGVSANACLALGFGYLIGVCYMRITPSWEWCTLTGLFLVVTFVHAAYARKEIGWLVEDHLAMPENRARARGVSPGSQR